MLNYDDLHLSLVKKITIVWDVKPGGGIWRIPPVLCREFVPLIRNASWSPRGGGYSTLAWTGVCRPDLGTLTHV